MRLAWIYALGTAATRVGDDCGWTTGWTILATPPFASSTLTRATFLFLRFIPL